MIFITGGLGFIGSHVTRELLDRGEQVIAVRRGRGPCSFLVGRDGLRTVDGDVTDPEMWTVATGASTIIHLAAGSTAGDPIEGVVSAVRSTAHALRTAGQTRARVVCASTIGVYAGTPAATPWPEDAALALGVPASIPAAKKAMESLLAVADDVDTATVRLPAVYGPLGNPASRFFALPALVHAAARDRAAELSAPMTADAGIDLVEVGDAARAIVDLALSPRLAHRVYNVGSGRATTNAEMFAAVAAARPGAHLAVEWASADATSPAVLDVERIRTDVGWTPRHDLAEGVARYLAWLEGGEER